MNVSCPTCGLRTECPCRSSYDPALGESVPAVFPEVTVHQLAQSVVTLLESFKAQPDREIDDLNLGSMLRSAMFPFACFANDMGYDRYEYLVAMAASADDAWQHAQASGWVWNGQVSDKVQNRGVQENE